MNRKSLAQNHLSNFALKGRFGDTELAHVNPQEKSMLKSMGGSGGINPNTGLREYQTGSTPTPTPPLSTTDKIGKIGGNIGSIIPEGETGQQGGMKMLSAGLNLIPGIGPALGVLASVAGSVMAHNKKKDEARKQMRMLSSQSAELEKAGGKLVEAKEAKEESVSTDYVSGTTTLGTKEGATERGIKKGLESTGLVKSSGISEMEFQTEQEFDIGKKSLATQLDKSMGEVGGWFAGEQGKIGAQKKQIAAQMRQQKAASEEKWMGIV